MSENKPRPKDRVQVSFHADWVGEQDGQRIVDIADGMGPIHVQIPAWASVEVLERADGPATDLIGTVRGMGEKRQPWAKRNENEWVCITHDETTDDREMETCPVIGVVPSTPAWERQQAGEPFSVTLVLPCGHDSSEHGPSCPDPADGMAARERRGEDVQTLHDDGSDEYARAVSDANRQMLCTVEDCPAAPRCSSGAAVWHYRTSACTEPVSGVRS